MSPFLVYLLFQADSIGNALGLIAIFSGMALFIAIPAVFMLKNDSDEVSQGFYKASRFVCWIAPFLLCAGIFMPSSKTIAAMIVLPKITSPQALDAMGKESRDIYELAKKALSNLADDKYDKAATK